MLFYVTCASLDIALGLGWWLTKTTIQGIYYTANYFIYKNSVKKLSREELLEELKNLQKQIEYIK